MSSQRRKENSRSAAQQQRRILNSEFVELSKELPLAKEICAEHIDKTTMVRLAASYIKRHQLISFGLPQYEVVSQLSSECLEVLDGCLFIVDSLYDILYVSETISIYLGLSQVEMIGNQFVDYFHWEDRQFLFDRLCNEIQPCQMAARFKSSLTKRANKATSRACLGYKVVSMEAVTMSGCILLYCRPLPSLLYSSVPLPPSSLVISVMLDFTITYASTEAENLLRPYYSSKTSICGTSLYKYVHVEDAHILGQMHCNVFHLRTDRTPFYRLILNQTNESVYIQSTAYRYLAPTTKGQLDTITIVAELIQ